jgi:hypothetical protein
MPREGPLVATCCVVLGLVLAWPAPGSAETPVRDKSGGAPPLRLEPARDNLPKWVTSPPQREGAPVKPPAAAAPATPAAPAVPAREPEATAWSEADVKAGRQACAARLAKRTIEWEEAPAMRLGACGHAAPIRLKGVAGVALQPPAIVTCEVAAQLDQWLTEVLQPAARALLGAPLVSLEGTAGYECRLRNRASTGRLSEHGLANALDINAFTAANGRSAIVGRHWSGPIAGGGVAVPVRRQASDFTTNNGAAEAATAEGTFLTRAHQGACGIFTTVLGPAANAAHREHMHVDLAQRRSGNYCQ